MTLLRSQLKNRRRRSLNLKLPTLLSPLRSQSLSQLIRLKNLSRTLSLRHSREELSPLPLHQIKPNQHSPSISPSQLRPLLNPSLLNNPRPFKLKIDPTLSLKPNLHSLLTRPNLRTRQSLLCQLRLPKIKLPLLRPNSR